MLVDLGMGTSHNASNHPIETPQLSHIPYVMRVNLTKTGDARSRTGWSAVLRPFRCSSCGLGVMDCRPKRIIADSEAANVVLRRAIEAINVVRKTR